MNAINAWTIHRKVLLLAAAILTSPFAAVCMADDAADRAALQDSRQKAIRFLRSVQGDDGSWTTPEQPGITAMATAALLRSGQPADAPTVSRALKHLESHRKPDGGIYFTDSLHRNYETCITIMVFELANADGRYDEVIGRAQSFLRELQWDEGEGVESSDEAYGGGGYGRHERPDLSNPQFLIEALRSTGVPADDPAIQKALIFVSRCQNLESEFNTTRFAPKINDGGLFYTPAAGGTSQAGTTANGGLRSYGSMTYAGLKSMVYAGLTSEDKRVKAAFNWIQKFYTLEENPGLGQQGLYYYFHTFAKALSVLEVDHLIDADGNQHDWRRELAQKLTQLQQQGGYWSNRADRWYEGDPNLCTAYALLALSYCD